MLVGTTPSKFIYRSYEDATNCHKKYKKEKQAKYIFFMYWRFVKFWNYSLSNLS